MEKYILTFFLFDSIELRIDCFMQQKYATNNRQNENYMPARRHSFTW